MTTSHFNEYQEFANRELETACNLVGGLLETNWTGILKAVAENPESKGSVSISLKINHLTADTRNLKASISYSVKTSDEAECIVRNKEAEEAE